MTVKSQQVITNFGGGIVSPLYYAAADAEKYQNSLQEGLNWLILPQGAALYRPGWEHEAVCENTAPENTRRLVKFAAAGMDYLLEFGHLYLQIRLDGKKVKRFVTPWAADVLPELQFAQKRLRMILVHPDTRPWELSRETTGTAFTFAERDFIALPQYDFDDELSPLPEDQINDITFTGAPDNSEYQLIYGGQRTDTITYTTLSAAVNEARIRNALQSLPSIGSESTVTVAEQPAPTYRVTISGPDAGKGIIQALGISMPDPVVTEVAAGGSRAEDAWSDTRGWPTCVTFYEQRLVLAATSQLPEFVWYSAVGDYLNFNDQDAIYDADPLSLAIDSSETIVVRWLLGGSNTIIGTNEGHYLISGSQGPLAPTAFEINETTDQVAARVLPVKLNSETVYVGDGRHSLMTLYASDERRSGIAQNLLNHASHLPASGLNQPHRISKPDTLLAVQTDRNEVLVCSYNLEGGMAAWCRLQHAQGPITAAAVLSEGEYDSLYIVVNWGGEFHVERLRLRLYATETGEAFGWKDLPYLDSCVQQITTTETNEITGLGHLNGETCACTVDQAYHPPVVPSGGKVTTQFAGKNIVVGKSYPDMLKTQQLAGGSPRGVALGQRRKWTRAYLNLAESVQPHVNGVKPDMRTPATPMGEAEPHVTGHVEYRVEGWRTDGVLTIENPHDAACCVAGIYGEVTVGSV